MSVGIGGGAGRVLREVEHALHRRGEVPAPHHRRRLEGVVRVDVEDVQGEGADDLVARPRSRDVDRHLGRPRRHAGEQRQLAHDQRGEVGARDGGARRECGGTPPASGAAPAPRARRASGAARPRRGGRGPARADRPPGRGRIRAARPGARRGGGGPVGPAAATASRTVAAASAWPRSARRSARARRTSVTSGAASSALRYSAIGALVLPGGQRLSCRGHAPLRHLEADLGQSGAGPSRWTPSRAAARRRCCSASSPLPARRATDAAPDQGGDVVGAALEDGRERARGVRGPALPEHGVPEPGLDRHRPRMLAQQAHGIASRRPRPAPPSPSATRARRPALVPAQLAGRPSRKDVVVGLARPRRAEAARWRKRRGPRDRPTSPTPTPSRHQTKCSRYLATRRSGISASIVTSSPSTSCETTRPAV